MTRSPAITPAALTRAEAAKYLNVCTRTIDRLVERGQLARVLIAAKPVFIRSDLDAFLRDNRTREGRHAIASQPDATAGA